MKIKTRIESAHPASPRRALLLLFVLLLVAIASVTPIFPQRVTPASASADQFSAERAMAHLPVIAAEPHPQGSPAQAACAGLPGRAVNGYGPRGRDPADARPR